MDKIKPAVLASIPVIILSVTPLVSMGCCLWSIGGGILASFLLYKTIGKIDIKEGTLVGLITGLISGSVVGLINIILSMYLGTANQILSEFQGTGLSLETMGVIAYVLALVLNIFVLGIFCMVGGVIGGAIWQQTQPQGPKKVN
ncbi:MAG: hypothetical protein ACOCZ6_01135 [Nanoarchaeota archaeon]